MDKTDMVKKTHKTIQHLMIASLLGAVLCFTSPSLSYGQDGLSNGFAGSYLSARFAGHQKDWTNASKFMYDTLNATNHKIDTVDPALSALYDSSLILSIGSGDMDKAIEVSKKINDQSDLYSVAVSMLAFHDIKQGDFKSAQDKLERLPEVGINLYTKIIIQSWIDAEQSDLKTALSTLRTLPEQDHNPMFNITAALLSEYKNDIATATLFYKNAEEEFMTLRSAMMIAKFHERSGNTEKALEIYQTLKETKPHHDGIAQGIERIETGKKAPFAIDHIQQGLATSLFDFSSFLYDQKGYETALIYTRMANYLNQSDQSKQTTHDIQIMLGDLMVIYDHLDTAQQIYESIPSTSANYTEGLIRHAETLERKHQYQSAIEKLKKAQMRHPSDQEILIRLGDIHRRNHLFEPAIEYYNQAEKAFKKDHHRKWNLHYVRALSYDQLGQWDMAEKDLITALELNQNHPLVLNYLGYSWINHGKNMEEAFDMIKKAVALKPDNPYIYDSFGWALFKMGNFEQAVLALEQAVAMAPHDSVINDHLGDAYWRTGRKTEAKYQWSKALRSMDNQNDIVKLNIKIQDGLPGIRLENTALENSSE